MSNGSNGVLQSGDVTPGHIATWTTDGVVEDGGPGAISTVGSLSASSVLANGTSTPRTLGARFADVFNVKDFGALGNGVNNDTAAINAAISAAGTTGAVLVPPGSYVISAPLTIPVNTTFLTINATFSNTVTGAVALSSAASLTTPDQLLSGGANVTSASLAAGNVTIDCGKCPLQFISNNAAFTVTAPVSDGSMMLLVTNSASAGAISFSGFSVGANTGDLLTTVNGSKFTISIWRINGLSGAAGYRVAAHQ